MRKTIDVAGDTNSSETQGRGNRTPDEIVQDLLKHLESMKEEIASSEFYR